MAEMVGSGVYYLHGDSLGSVRMATTPSAAIAFSSEYTPYGGSYALVGVEALMYTGKEYDSVSGLYYEGARYYDPTTGRFVTEDSYGGTRGDPMTLNRYVYAADDPMRYVDPTGHMLAAAPGGGGTASSTTCTASPDVCASESGANAASLVTVSPGISAKPPDVELTQGGSDQYRSEPTIGLGPTTQPQGNEIGAALVVVLLGTLTVASGLATVLSSPLVLTGIGAVVPAALASTTIGLAYSTFDAGAYTYSEGPNATPEGAFASTPLDVMIQWLGDTISSLP